MTQMFLLFKFLNLWKKLKSMLFKKKMLCPCHISISYKQHVWRSYFTNSVVNSSLSPSPRIQEIVPGAIPRHHYCWAACSSSSALSTGFIGGIIRHSCAAINQSTVPATAKFEPVVKVQLTDSISMSGTSPRKKM